MANEQVSGKENEKLDEQLDQQLGQRSIESDDDTLEPFDDINENREVNADNPADVAYWAKEFQVSVPDLKAAIILNGNSLRAIKKYLNI